MCPEDQRQRAQECWLLHIIAQSHPVQRCSEQLRINIGREDLWHVEDEFSQPVPVVSHSAQKNPCNTTFLSSLPNWFWKDTFHRCPEQKLALAWPNEILRW